jgi:dTMP kinase
VRDRFEEADREFFRRVEQGYEAIAASERERVRAIDAARDVEVVAEEVWRCVEPLLAR